ncbi:MAG: hypothetical protein Q9227_007456 [Pyrenula ochraceoflavens]
MATTTIVQAATPRNASTQCIVATDPINLTLTLAPSQQDRLTNLPSELLLQILSHLPIPTLLTLSRTNKTLHSLAPLSLNTLHLAAFPKKLHSVLAFLPSGPAPTDRHLALTTPRLFHNNVSPSIQHKATIRHQNSILSSALRTHGRFLTTLTFHAFDISAATATDVGTCCPRLRHLSIHCDNAHARHASVPRALVEGPASPHAGWNALAGIGRDAASSRVMGKLESLRLERVGITSFQLKGLVERNPGLKELCLRKVSGVDEEFVEWLGGEWAGRKKLKVLEVEECDELRIEEEKDAEWVKGLEGLEVLSFHRCANVDAELTTRLNEEEWKVQGFVPLLDLGSPVVEGLFLEVDPEYK